MKAGCPAYELTAELHADPKHFSDRPGCPSGQPFLLTHPLEKVLLPSQQAQPFGRNPGSVPQVSSMRTSSSLCSAHAVARPIHCFRHSPNSRILSYCFTSPTSTPGTYLHSGHQENLRSISYRPEPLSSIASYCVSVEGQVALVIFELLGIQAERTLFRSDRCGGTGIAISMRISPARSVA